MGGSAVPAPDFGTDPDFLCAVNADFVRRAAVCRSTESGRFNISGISVEPCPAGGVLLIATDGRRMIVIRDPDGIVRGKGVISPTKAVLAVSKTPTKRSVLGRIELRPRIYVANKRHAAVIAPDSIRDVWDWGQPALVDAPTAAVLAYQWHSATMDSRFPDWRRVVPKAATDSLPIGTFNAELLIPLALALGQDKTSLLSLIGTGGPPDPILVFGEARRMEAFGIIMPTRGSSHAAAAPDWAHWPA